MRVIRSHRLFFLVATAIVLILGATAFVLFLRRQPYFPVYPPSIANIPYVTPDDGLRRLDIFFPEQKAGPLPTLLMLHGSLGDKTNMSSLAVHFAQQGYAVVLPSYRIHPVQMNDGYCALGWTVVNAAKYRLDVHHIFLIGWSSGGGIAAELGTVHDATPYMSDCPSFVPQERWTQGLILYAAGSDRWSGTGWKTDVAPLLWLDGHEPPTLVLHGSNDTLVAPADSEQLAAALRAVGDKVELSIIPGADHFSIIPGNPENAQVLKIMDDFLARQTAGTKN